MDSALSVWAEVQFGALEIDDVCCTLRRDGLDQAGVMIMAAGWPFLEVDPWERDLLSGRTQHSWGTAARSTWCRA